MATLSKRGVAASSMHISYIIYHVDKLHKMEFSPDVAAEIRCGHWQVKCLLFFSQYRMAVALLHFSPRISNTSKQTVDRQCIGIS